MSDDLNAQTNENNVPNDDDIQESKE